MIQPASPERVPDPVFLKRVYEVKFLEAIISKREIQNPFGGKETSDFEAIAFKANLNDFK